MSLVLSQLGFVCAEMLYVSKNVHGTLQECVSGWNVSELTVLLAQMVISVPMAWIRRLEFFKWTNVVANGTVLAALVIILLFSLRGLAQHGPADDIDLVGSGWLLFVGTSVFCFECINFVIPMYAEHENKETFVPVLTKTLWSVMGLFILFGLVNYLNYGSGTKTTITLNLPSGSFVGKVVPLAFAFASLLNIPLFLFPASITLEAKLLGDTQRSLARTWSKNGLRTLLVLLCTAVAIAGARQIQALIALIGSLCCVPLAFIFPTLSHMRLCRPGLAGQIVDVAFAIFGSLLFLFTTTRAIMDLRSGV